jgi:hypothetical protein
MHLQKVCWRYPTGTPGGQEAYPHPFEGEGVPVGVGETVGFIDEESLFQGIIQEGERNHDGLYDVPDEGTGVGMTHFGNGISIPEDGISGVGEAQVGMTTGFGMTPVLLDLFWLEPG